MISGVMEMQGPPTDSICKLSLDYNVTDNGKYCVYPTYWLPSVPFGPAKIYWTPINRFWLNDSFNNKCATKLKLQNFMSTRYGGRLPRRFFGKGDMDPMGTVFSFIATNGDIEYRYFVDRSNDQYRNTHAGDTNVIYSR